MRRRRRPVKFRLLEGTAEEGRRRTDGMGDITAKTLVAGNRTLMANRADETGGTFLLPLST